MAFTKIVGAGIHTLSNIHSHNVNSSGIITATKFIGPITGAGGDFNAGIVTATSLDVNGGGDISGDLTVGGSLTVNGDFTTLNTTLREVELLRVDASTSSIAGIITQSGSGHALYVDGTTILGNSQYVPTFNAATQLAVANLSGNSNSVDMTILGGRAGKSMIRFGDHDSNNRGSIQYHHTDESIRFYNNGNGITPRLTIASSGSVGIGTDDPQKLLELEHVANRKLQFSYDDNTVTIKSSNNNGNPENLRFIGYDLIFHTGTSGSANEALRITDSGLVKIDEASPVNSTNGANAKLQVKSLSQYDGLLLGHGYEYGMIGRGASNGALIYTSNASPGNLGGGEKIMHEWWSGSSGGGGPNSLMVLSSSSKLGIGVTIPDKELTIASARPTIKLIDSDVANNAAFATIDASSHGGMLFDADPNNVRSGTDFRFNVDGDE